jgi:Lrp/AsnC family transcriptional regulator
VPETLDRYEKRIPRAAAGRRLAVDRGDRRKVGLSSSPCWRRIDRLEREGFIKRKVALVDRKKIGLNAQIFAQIKLNAHGRANLDEFAAAIRAFPEVLECYVLMGSVDFLIRVVATDIEAYERFFFDRLSQLPGVQEVNSTVALSEIKATTHCRSRDPGPPAGSVPKRAHPGETLP